MTDRDELIDAKARTRRATERAETAEAALERVLALGHRYIAHAEKLEAQSRRKKNMLLRRSWPLWQEALTARKIASNILKTVCGEEESQKIIEQENLYRG